MKGERFLRCNKWLGYGHIACDCPNGRYINLAKVSLNEQQKNNEFCQRQSCLIRYMLGAVEYEDESGIALEA